MARAGTWLRRALLGLGAAVALFLAFELAARVYLTRFAPMRHLARFGSYDQTAGRWRSRLTPSRYTGYTTTPGFERGADRHDSRGFRGDELARPKPVGELRIACLGGSTTYTTAVSDHRESYPAQLERVLVESGAPHVRVINAGVEGWGSWESLVDFEFRVLDAEPDLIVVYHAVNDVPPRLVWPPESYSADNGGYRAPLAPWGSERPLAERSTFLRMLLIAAGRLDPPSHLAQADPFAATFVGDDYDRQIRAGTYPIGPFAGVPIERVLESNAPEYFRRNLLSQIAVARAHDVGVVLLTFANLPPDPVARDTYINAPVYAQGIAEANEVVREVAARTQVPLFDLARSFPLDPSLFNSWTQGGHTVVDSHHVNALGAREMAELIGAFLLERGLVERR